jgi:hypothetical protein
LLDEQSSALDKLCAAVPSPTSGPPEAGLWGDFVEECNVAKVWLHYMIVQANDAGAEPSQLPAATSALRSQVNATEQAISEGAPS